MRQFSFKKISSPFQCRFNFSISIQRYHDIVPLNLGQNIYCNLKKYKFEFSPEGTLRQFRQKIQTQYPDIQKLNIYEPYTLAEFTENTPIKEIYSTDFIIKLNNEAFYKIISDIDIKIFRNFDLTNKMIANEINQSFHLLSGLGSKKANSIILSHFVNSLHQEILNVKEDKIDVYYFKIALKKIIGEIALKEKIIEKDLVMQVKLLESKIQNLKRTNEKIIKLLEVKGKRRVNCFLGFLAGQVALIQYATYVAFSWDIIEPITCLLGVLDMIIAYSFWLYSQKEYSFEALKTHYIFRRINYYIKFNFSELLVQKKTYEDEIKVIERLLSLTSMQRDIFRADWENLKKYF